MEFSRFKRLSTSRWKLASTVLVGCMATALFAPSVQAASFTLDFETDAFGNPLDAKALDTHSKNGRIDVGQLWADLGITITGSKSGGAPLGLFNTNCVPKGGTSSSGFTVACEEGRHGDNDLATGKGSYGKISYDTQPQGNALIFEENPGNGIPDDTSKGGEIRFDFNRTLLSSVKIEKIGIIDDARGEITVNYTDGTRFVQAITNSKENQLQFFNPDNKQVQDFIVKFNGSGAISGVVFSEFNKIEAPTDVPEPMAGLGLLLVGGYGLKTLNRNRQES